MFKHKLLVLCGVLLVAAALISDCGPGGGSGGGQGTTLNVQGAEFGYTPNTLTVKAGEAVTVNFKNTGTVEHTFVIKDLNFKLVAQPGQTTKGSFTAPATAGTHEIHCDIAGHTEAGMKGTLTVTAS
jgi:plastocyanin